MTIIQKIKQKEKLMNRRNFLKFNALTLASMGVAYANPMHDMHSMHKNHSINHDLDTSFINFAPKNSKKLQLYIGMAFLCHLIKMEAHMILS